MAKRPLNLPTLRLVVIAAVAGIAAGALGVYVTGGLSGNSSVAMSDEAAACAAKTDLAARVGEAARGEVAAMLAASPPRPVADLAFMAPDGTPMTLADRAGTTLLVNLWATWCAPCRHEMPALDQLQAELGGDGFEVVAVNVDTGTEERPLRFLDEIGVAHLAFYRDSTLGLFNDLKTRGLAFGLPVTLLVDAEGCLLAHMNGPAEWASDDAKRLIAAARP